jgi:hypothetical protein
MMASWPSTLYPPPGVFHYVANLFAAGWRLYRRVFWPFFGLAVLFHLPDFFHPHVQPISGHILNWLLCSLSAFFLKIWIGCLFVHFASELVLGNQPSLPRLGKKALSQIHSFAWVGFLFLAVSAVPLGLVLIPGMFLLFPGGHLAAGLFSFSSILSFGALFLVLLVFLLFWICPFWLSTSVVVLEGVRGRAALHRSVFLMNEGTGSRLFLANVWRVIVFFLFLTVISVVLIGPLGFVYGFSRDLLYRPPALLLSALITPLGMLASTVFYYDVRKRAPTAF